MSSPNRISVIGSDGIETVLYEPQPYQRPFHESNTKYILALGTRNTGKSTALRWDAIARCLTFPNFRALIIRRTIPDLRKTHLNFIEVEMIALGGKFNRTFNEAQFPNGSKIIFTHCETKEDVVNFLGSEWGFIGFDELSTFSLEMFLLIQAAGRVSKEKPYKAVIRACSNPLGIGAEWMKQWFIDKSVDLEEFSDYHPDDFEMQYSTLEDNKYIDIEEYKKSLKILPDHVKRAWLLGEFVIEGAYFGDFRKTKDGGVPWHVIPTLPTWNHEPLLSHSWISVYRAIDWGYSPDPAVCLWIIVLPNKRAVVFKERSWKRTLAKDVALAIKKESEDMHIVESFCDPTMLIKEGQAYSIGEIFEQNGVPVTASTNDRKLYGYSIHEYLNTLVDDLPQLQIVQPLGLYGCPDLIRTLPLLRMDKNDPSKIADGEDHWAVALAYFCMGQASPSKDPQRPSVPRWMMSKERRRASFL